MDQDSAMSSYHAPAPSTSPFRLDEGFSEEVLSQDEHARQAMEHLQEWIMAQSEGTRMDIAYEILRTLRTSNIAAVVDRLTPLLHMDPIEKLPPELTAEIFAYLDASTLLTASLASHTWRGRILDSRLWQKLFVGQGWGIDEVEFRRYENSLGLSKTSLRSKKGKERINARDEPQLKKRATANWLDSRERQMSADVSQWREQHGTVEADTDAQSDSGDQEMQDAPSASQGSPQRPNKRHSQESGDEMDYHPAQTSSTLAQVGRPQSSGNLAQRFRPTLTTFDSNGEQSVNWAYLYKQRRRLEENWTRGRYLNFQLPDPAHPQEAHTECVYCIQFAGKWLVSGSRDKTLRVWDLETRRLRGRPLTGHSQSVLCLQFDPSEGEDVIISGSSDSSVLIWKFSTGQKLHEIPSAHEESVLNLRFDKRYLVTCSKDKKIKVWNRKLLSPQDAEYPRIGANTEAARVPTYIIDAFNMEPSLLEARLASGAMKSLKPYSHLITFSGHGAAVNAIQIHGDMIVSASGDRLIKVWNVKTGRMLRSLLGHNKGIACVQFDSRRIVSGSSDNTVRIFDPYTGAEVAELKGHSNLVRTVQAGFGDLPGSETDYLIQAREAEAQTEQDIITGRQIDDRQYRRRLRAGELGTSRIAFGSSLPPGGGGSRWGKIVSGSYDESIIIWRKNAEGEWTQGLTLKQEAAVRAVRGGGTVQQAVQQAAPGPAPIATPVQAAAPVPPQPTHSAPATPAAAVQHGSSTASSNVPGINPTQVMAQAVNSSFSSLGAGLSSVMGIARNIQAPGQTVNVPPRSSSGQSNLATSASAAIGSSFSVLTQQQRAAIQQQQMMVAMQRMQALADARQQQEQGSTSNAGPSNAGPATQHTTSAAPGQSATGHQSNQPQQANHHTNATATANSSTNLPQTITTTNTNTNTAPQPPAPPPPPAPAPAPANANNPAAPATAAVSRVFKLQFDARRIVCCSQDSRIIGWDFANGDEEIMGVTGMFEGP